MTYGSKQRIFSEIESANAARHPRQVRAIQRKQMSEVASRYCNAAIYSGLEVARKQLADDFRRITPKPIIASLVSRALLTQQSTYQ